MLRAVASVVVAVGWVVGATVVGWWAGGGWVPALLLGAFSTFVAFSTMVPLAFALVDAGSVRQARRALREAREQRRGLAVLLARLRLRTIRWQRGERLSKLGRRR